MKIIVGSQNTIKVTAVTEMITDYALLRDAKVIGKSVDTEVAEQPKSLDETIRGAMQRATNAFADCDYSIGIEGGLASVPYTKTDYMNITACVIYDGKQHHVGLSSGFEYPHKVMQLVFAEGLDVSQSFHKAGFTDKKNIGAQGGVVGALTKGRLVRKDYVKQAVMMALIHLENEEYFIN